jgi:hypothetical protein
MQALIVRSAVWSSSTMHFCSAPPIACPSGPPGGCTIARDCEEACRLVRDSECYGPVTFRRMNISLWLLVGVLKV